MTLTSEHFGTIDEVRAQSKVLLHRYASRAKRTMARRS